MSLESDLVLRYKEVRQRLLHPNTKVLPQGFGLKHTVKPVEKPKPQKITMTVIIESVCEYFGLTISELRSPSHKHKYTRPRQIAMILGRELTAYSSAQIAREFRRHHTTVLHAVWKDRDKLEPDLSAIRKALV